MIHYNPKVGLASSSTYNVGHWQLLPSMAAMGVFTAGICYIELEVLEEPMEEQCGASLLGFGCHCFSFSDPTAYDRWWEGRKQWGGLVESFAHLGHSGREFRMTLLPAPTSAGNSGFVKPSGPLASGPARRPRGARTTEFAAAAAFPTPGRNAWNAKPTP